MDGDRGDVVLSLHGITKRFPGVVANDGITLDLRRGGIHALLGENGAGKSTLMNIVFGLLQPDEGTINIRGVPTVVQGANHAISLGIGMVHQHFKLVPPFTVTENIILGREPRKGLRLDKAAAARDIAALSDRYGLNVDPNALVENISVGMQQRVEILKTLYRGAEILILDEPTAVLTPQEITDLLGIMRQLRNEGKSIILITHKLREIMESADRCTIIRRGRVIETVAVADTNPNELAAKMVGRSVDFRTDKSPAKPGGTVLSIHNLHVRDDSGHQAVKGLNLEVRAGEIVGIAGVDGNGQLELAEAIAGLRKPDSGRIRLGDTDITGANPRRAGRAGVAYIPPDRHRHGLVLDFDIAENAILKTYHRRPYTRRFLMDMGAARRTAEGYVKGFDIRVPDTRTKAGSMSGGNQQKLILAREMDNEPRLIVAAQPTRGLDIGAISFVHQRLVRARDQGQAILLVSFELDEVLNLSDRIVVMFNGAIAGETRPENTSDEELGLMMAGKAGDRKEAGSGGE